MFEARWPALIQHLLQDVVNCVVCTCALVIDCVCPYMWRMYGCGWPRVQCVCMSVQMVFMLANGYFSLQHALILYSVGIEDSYVPAHCGSHLF